ncbi:MULTISPECIES: peptidoglycan D,D-transpeptidase FtsI family protein [Nitrincola]|uniref:Peptidoglycan D,D-transpeptidase FtsI n=1 Tax=Nitrincola nitratireducens TaxID=1229521 RepID=W9V450_9GAMM|nr:MULTISPECIES: penicillin-binding transpeptidase domain-containing protein [Nitrincola]EXJ11716.1 Peptidoglycan synthase FtsI precursor [Nitrincola nitratireducens]
MSSKVEQHQGQAAKGWRLWLVFAIFLVLVVGITGKLLSLYMVDQAFLQNQGDARSVRTMLIPAHRGLITDRNGEPLAVSAPVASIWVDPRFIDVQHRNFRRLSQVLEIPHDELLSRLQSNAERRFVYLRRQVTPELAENVQVLGIPGVNVDREYRRFYPAGEVTAHIVGFTNVDGEGQEGMELAYEQILSGEHGRKLVMRDRVGRTISHIRSIQDAQPGTDLQLSIDLRLQYMAYRELKAVVEAHNADSGSVVILDVQTGEVLAMVNQPSYNPNDRSRLQPAALRNRAMTDLFEPGSTVKPMSVAAALMTGRYKPDTVVKTSPGTMRVRNATIRDFRNYGDLDLTGIITKSSNVGTVRLVLDMEHDRLPSLLQNMGMGQMTHTGFPGERSGVLPFVSERQVVERATMSYGYGLSVTPLQLAQAYIPFASDGIMRPVSLLKIDENKGHRIMPEGVGHQVLDMMETVIGPAGTARRAAVTGYRVAGKTGTVHRLGSSGYNRDEYTAVFAGIAPVSDPRLAVVVMVDNPKGREYYGGEVAAPVFSRVTQGAMRLLNIDPDKWPEGKGQVANR